MRLCELLQAGGVRVRPLGRHLAISLPSLPLRLWDAEAPGPAPTHTDHPPPPSCPPSERQLFTPVWQPPRPHSPSDATATPQHRPGPSPTAGDRHWSSWSLDRPDAVVTPYHTPPDRCISIRPQAPRGQRCSCSCQSSPGHYSSQHAPGQQCQPGCEHDEAELTELDSLYQASLQAGRTGTHAHTRARAH